MIVCEGPDGAGKTTLVKYLTNRFNLNVGQRGVTNRDKLYEVTRQDTYRALSMAVLGKEDPLVWDRLFVSEFVYHDIHPQRPCEFKGNEARFIQSIMNSLGHPMIVCLPPWDVVRANEEGTHQMEGVHESLEHIYHVYAEGYLPWPDNVIWYDYTLQTPHFASLEAVEEEVEGYMADRKEREAWQR